MSNIVVLLDQSGSMVSMGPEPVQALNSFINEQKAVGEGTLSIYTFDTKVKKVVDKIPLKDTETFSDYKPDGLTALYDCIKTAITENEEKNITMVIITDGDDNMSKTTHDTAKDMMAECEKNKGWKIVYLGADGASFKNGSALGLTNVSRFVQGTPGDLARCLTQASQMISPFRSANLQ